EFGISSRIHKYSRNTSILPDSNRNPKLYDVKDCYKLMIGKNNRSKFMENISFSLSRKNERYKEIMQNLADRDFMRSHYNEEDNEKYISKINSIKYVGIDPVYDIAVENS